MVKKEKIIPKKQENLYSCKSIAGVTSGAGGPGPPLAESLEEQKFVSKREENYKRKPSTT